MGLLQFMFGRKGPKDSLPTQTPLSSRREQKTRISTHAGPIVDKRQTLQTQPPPAPQTTSKHVKNFSQTSFLQNSTVNNQQADDSKSVRKSRRFSLGRVKAEDTLRKRRSIFGAPASKVLDQVPELPTMPTTWQSRDRRGKPSIEDLVRPGTALTVDAPIPAARVSEDLAAIDRINRQLSLLEEKPARKSSITRKPNTLQRKRSNRKSLFGGEADDDGEDEAPVLPAVPVRLVDPKMVEKRKSQNATGKHKSSRSSSDHRKSQRWSLFQSKTPDSNPESVPSVPVLAREVSTIPHLPKSSYHPSVSYYSVYPNTAAPAAAAARSASTTASTQTQVPKSTGKGLLDSTMTSEEPPRSLGLSLLDDDETVSFLSPDQQREWDKLKLLMEALDARNDGATTNTATAAANVSEPLEARGPKSAAECYSNAEALAALEFGEAF